MFVSRIVVVTALAAIAACSLPPEPGAPAPTGITSSRGGGVQSVDPLRNAGATAGGNLPAPAPTSR